jgi:hypothetical protein
MRSTPAITMAPASQDAGAAAEIAAERPTYRYAGDGRFLPDNQAAIEECRRFNVWADQVNSRTSRSQ